MLDKMDDEIRAQYGTDYAFLFQYLYPRIAELKMSANVSAEVIGRIGTALSDGTQMVADT
jgi:hypothetical protein